MLALVIEVTIQGTVGLLNYIWSFCVAIVKIVGVLFYFFFKDFYNYMQYRLQ